MHPYRNFRQAKLGRMEDNRDQIAKRAVELFACAVTQCRRCLTPGKTVQDDLLVVAERTSFRRGNVHLAAKSSSKPTPINDRL